MAPQQSRGFASLLAVGVAAYAAGWGTSEAVRSKLAGEFAAGLGLRGPSSSSSSSLPGDGIGELPALAQYVLPGTFAVLGKRGDEEANLTTIFVPPGSTMESLAARPFHVHHPDFLRVLGPTPSLTLIAESEDGNPLFHEAVVWHPPTDEVFFAQNAGAPAAGTGLKKSAIMQKVQLRQADAVGRADVAEVPFRPAVVNPNGGTNYNGNILIAGEGMGADIPSALYLVNPEPPYNTTTLLDNYFGRQFNSLNDVAVHPSSGHIYFTDVTYGYLQDFRPRPVLPNQVYRFDPRRGSVVAVADDAGHNNGITFSPDGKYAYVTDTGANRAFYGWIPDAPAGIYRYTVAEDGSFEHRKLFAHVSSGVADGVHCDADGNVYAGCGDGLHVWSPAGVLLGRVFLGEASANFQFAGDGRVVVCAETRLYYVRLAARGAPLT